MSLNVTFNGSLYIIPETGEVGWGGNTTSYLVAIAAGALQKTGGSFTLSAEIDFGASFGIKSLYYKSRSANIAAAGILRLNNNSDSINWRNAANSADLALFPNASNLLTFNGSTVYVLGAGTITNADISPTAGIVYTKLNLTNSIVNADINAAAAIAYSKLNLVGSIVNADVNASAAIVYSKLTLTNSIVNADINAAAAIAYSKLTLTNSIVNADINATAAIAFTKMAAMTASRMTVSDTSGFLVASAWSYNATNDLTTGANDELRFQDSAGGDYVAFRAPASVTTHTYDLPIAPGTAGQVLSWQAGGQLQWINAAGGGTINSGTQFQLAYYAANGTTLSGLTLITASRALVSDTNGLPVASTTSTTQLQALAALTASRALQTDGSGLVSVSTVTSTELGYVSGVTSAIQTQLNLLAPKANPVFTGVLSSPLGTAGSPTYTFTGDLDTGIYSPTANILGFSVGGTNQLQVESGELHMISAVIGATNGTAALPAYSFDSDLDCGMYRIGANDIGLSANGGLAAEWDSTNFQISRGQLFIQSGTAALPGLAFAGDPNTGLFRVSADRMQLVANGANRIDINDGSNYVYIVGQTRIDDGTVSLPGLAFNADTDTGLFRIAANRFALVTNGVSAWQVDSTAKWFSDITGATINNGDGSASTPSYSFNADSTTGFFRPGSGQIDVSSSGTRSLRFNTVSTANATVSRPLLVYGGSSQTTLERETVSGISTTATTIIPVNDDHMLLIVAGANSGGGQTFSDLVMIATTTFTVISSTTNGAPARTYSISGGNFRVAMASGTFGVAVQSFSLGRQNG